MTTELFELIGEWMFDFAYTAKAFYWDWIICGRYEE